MGGLGERGRMGHPRGGRGLVGQRNSRRNFSGIVQVFFLLLRCWDVRDVGCWI